MRRKQETVNLQIFTRSTYT